MRYAYGVDDPICGIALHNRRIEPDWYDDSEVESYEPRLPKPRSTVPDAYASLARQNAMALRIRQCLADELDRVIDGYDVSLDELECWCESTIGECDLPFSPKDALVLVEVVAALEPDALDSVAEATDKHARLVKPAGPATCEMAQFGTVRFA